MLYLYGTYTIFAPRLSTLPHISPPPLSLAPLCLPPTFYPPRCPPPQSTSSARASAAQGVVASSLLLASSICFTVGGGLGTAYAALSAEVGAALGVGGISRGYGFYAHAYPP